MRNVLIKIVLFFGFTSISSALMVMLFEPGTTDERAFAEMLVRNANSGAPPPCMIPPPYMLARGGGDSRFFDCEAKPIPYDLRLANLIMASGPRPYNLNSD